MVPELYAPMLLYTGNFIDQELNRCLRLEEELAQVLEVPEALFEGDGCDALAGGHTVVLRHRGPVERVCLGKAVKWWSISLRTASRDVAEDFMG